MEVGLSLTYLQSRPARDLQTDSSASEEYEEQTDGSDRRPDFAAVLPWYESQPETRRPDRARLSAEAVPENYLSVLIVTDKAI
jgi:hypothetical protein